MTILIKGIEMPMVCDDCWALDEYGDYPRCRITEEQRGYNFRIREQRMEHCPLVEVLTPHGRLIDADDFDSRIRAAGGLADEELTDDFKDGVLSVLTLMKTQNTVIEAEG